MNRLTICFLLLIGLLPPPELSLQDEAEARDLFRRYSISQTAGRAGAWVKIELKRGGRRSFVTPDTVFRAGDEIKFHFSVNFPAYVRIYNRGSSGKLDQLFPYAGVSSRVKPGVDYKVPVAVDEWFVFDEIPGNEQLFFRFSNVPVTRKSAARQPVKTNRERQEDIVVVREIGDSSEDDIGADQEMAEWEETRDIKRVRTNGGQIIFGRPGSDKSVRLTINLKHR